VADGLAAIDAAAGGPVAEGVVGAGTGMVTMELKAGIGTSSRVLPDLGTVGVLVLANFGRLGQLRVTGVPVGVTLAADAAAARGDAGSCIGVVATDIPLDARQLTRVARRVGLGLARVGSVAGHGSGDIFCAISTTNRRPRVAEGIHSVDLLGDDSIGAVFAATVDATEEAVTNALFVADTVSGRDGHVAPGLPVERVLALLGR
jgi:D-aminopeptidase